MPPSPSGGCLSLQGGRPARLAPWPERPQGRRRPLQGGSPQPGAGLFLRYPSAPSEASEASGAGAAVWKGPRLPYELPAGSVLHQDDVRPRRRLSQGRARGSPGAARPTRERPAPASPDGRLSSFSPYLRQGSRYEHAQCSTLLPHGLTSTIFFKN